MSGFTVNGTGLDDLLMQSSNNNSGSSGFIMTNVQDLYVRYGKWDGLVRNQAAATGYTVGGADINTKFNKKTPTFQATLSGTFEYTGEVIQPTITASPVASTEYQVTYKGNKVDAASYLAVQRDFELPTGYDWASEHPAGSFTITQKPITLTLSGTGSFEYNEGSRIMGVLYGGKTFSSYQIVSGSLGPITNVSQIPISVTVRANGNYTSDQVSGSIIITPKPITFSFSNDSSIVYNGSSYSIVITPSDSNTTYSISNGSVGPITNVSDGSRSVTVQANGNYSGSATSGTLTITPKAITITINGTGTFAYGSTRSMTYSLSESVPESSISTSGNTSITNGGTITYDVSLKGNYSGSALGTINIVQASITTQPTGGTGTSVSLSVTASGAPSGGSPSYQWQLNGNNISGATSSTLTANSSTGGSGSYKCVFTYTFNNVSHSVTSNAVDVTISTQTQTPLIIYAGSENGILKIGVKAATPAGDYAIMLGDSNGYAYVLGYMYNFNGNDTVYDTTPTVIADSNYYVLYLATPCNSTISPIIFEGAKSEPFAHYSNNNVSVNFNAQFGTLQTSYNCDGGGGGSDSIIIEYNSGQATANTNFFSNSGTAIMYLNISGLITNDMYSLSYSNSGSTGPYTLHTTFMASDNNIIQFQVDRELNIGTTYWIQIVNLNNNNNIGISGEIQFDASTITF
jgi:hypothetical protein